MENRYSDNEFENNMNTDSTSDSSIEDKAHEEVKEDSVPEHIISYREDDTVGRSTWHLSGDEMVKDDVKNHFTVPSDDALGTPVNTNRPVSHTVPEYSYPRYDGTGNVSYTPIVADTKKQKKKNEKQKKKGNGGAKAAVLAVLCVVLSFCVGIGGAALWSVVLEDMFLEEELTDKDNLKVEDKGNAKDETTADKDDGEKNPDPDEDLDEDEIVVEDENGDKIVVVQRPVEHVETSSDGSELTYSDVEALVGDSVVAITTEYKVVSYWQEYVTGGAGSGVVMSEDGYIITNYHVVAATNSYSEFADSVKISFKNGKEYDAEIIGGSSEMDIAVLKIEPEEGDTLTPAVFADSSNVKVGEEVLAIGNPLGEFSGTTTNGIISALAREVEIEGVVMNLLQTNAAVNPGNSGGGLFNMSGELIGVVNAKSSGTGIEGLGFAIPSNDALETATAIIENGGSVTTPANVKIGVSIVTISTYEEAREYGVNAYGVYVDVLEEGYNDDVLKSGDRIIAVDGQEIAKGDDVVQIVRSAEAGDKLEFIVYRNGRVKTVEVTVYENPEA